VFRINHLDFDPAAFQEDGFSLGVLPGMDGQEPGRLRTIFVLFDALAEDPAWGCFVPIGPKIHSPNIGMGDPDGIVMAVAERIPGMAHPSKRSAFRAGDRIEKRPLEVGTEMIAG